MNKFLPKVHTFTSVVLSLLFLISCAQEKTTTDKAAKIDELIGLYAAYEGFNGSVLVAHEGEIIYKNSFGKANMEWDIANQIDTKFQIASVTKTFTSMLIMQLVAETKLDLNEPISSYLPDYPKNNGEKITIHHLLTHSSGMGRDPSKEDKPQNRPKEMVNQFAEAPLQFTPGDRFEYSNSGYTLLGYIIETITGQTYEEVLKEKIFTPLSMENSGYYRQRPLIKNMASGYFKGFGDYFNAEDTDESTAYAAGAIYSTVEDLFLWDQALYNETLLPKKFLDEIFTKHMPDPSYGGYYGYGWELMDKSIGNTNKTIETIGHSGSMQGFCALYTRIPESNSTIIFLNNTKRAFLNAMTTAITGILNDTTYDFPKKPVAMLMSEVIKNEGIDKGIVFYKEHKDLDGYYKSEQELIVAGYRLLHDGNAQDASEVFKLSTEVFPDADNPYDSYAEALMALGKNDKAIKNYKKSFALNPHNQNAVKMLEKLGVKDAANSNDILDADPSWGKEIFSFPLNFARDIEFKGNEDARFAKGWRDENGPNFWTYAFAWNINLTSELTNQQLEGYMRSYYDGLMASVNREKGFVLPATTATFKKTNDNTFTGQVITYDAFTTKKPLTLNFLVKQTICPTNNNSIVLFLISPQDFDKDVWTQLEKIKIRENRCDN